MNRRFIWSEMTTSLDVTLLIKGLSCLSCPYNWAGLHSSGYAATVCRYRLRCTLQSVPKRAWLGLSVAASHVRM